MEEKNTVNIGLKDMLGVIALILIVALVYGIIYFKDFKNKEIYYQELTRNLNENELFGLINIIKNDDGTYTLYGAIYNKIDSFSAKLSNNYKKVTVSGDTKYVGYPEIDATLKDIYEINTFPREDNKLEKTIHANSTWLLKFNFTNSVCTLIEETNLAV